MVHLMEKEALARASKVVLLTLVWGGLAACAIGALVHDLTRWFAG